MKKLWLLFVFALPAVVSAQTYSIDWFSIDGGGGTSSGGIYSVTGTIGQPDAGASSGGAYEVQGGFWAVIALKVPGLPLLSVTRSSIMGDVTVSWPLTDQAIVLEQTIDLNTTPGSWALVAPMTYQTNAAKISITVPGPTTGTRYYRLHKP